MAAPITDYASLVTAAVAEAWRSGDADFLAGIPAALMALEDSLMLGSEEIDPLRVSDMLVRNAPVTLATGVGTLPTDCLEVSRVRVSGRKDLTPVALTWLDDVYPAGRAGDPAYYAIDGRTILVQPVSADSVNVSYYAKLPSLQSGANWLVAKAPSIYLYGLLTHMAPQMLEDQRMATWGTMFRSILGGLIRSDKRLQNANTVARNRGPTP